jgi:ubiquitin carboxyl-terminal hydrolase 16
LAGLGELRAYLVRRTRNAKANGELIGDGLTVDHKPFLTEALKDILDGGFMWFCGWIWLVLSRVA